MTLLTAMEIASNAPNGDIMISGVQNKETGKWISLMYLMRDGHIHKLMLSFDETETFKGWDTEDEAVKAMEDVKEMAKCCSHAYYWD